LRGEECQSSESSSNEEEESASTASEFSDLADLDDHHSISSNGSSSDEEGELPAFPVDNSEMVGKNGKVWNRTPAQMHQTPQHNLVREHMKVLAPGKGNATVMASFQKIMTPAIVQQIVRWTNQHIRKDTASEKETDETEMLAFMGLLLLLGVWKSSQEDLSEIWASNTGRPIFRATMTLARFRELLRHLRFDDRNTREQRASEDKLAPIRDVWDMFQCQLSAVYRPSPFLTVDEQLVPTRGRCSFKQYIPSKPNKYGVKVFWICDSANSYPLKGEIYIGRQPNATLEESRMFNKPFHLVKRLIEPWKGSGRNITCDNYFTSVPLACDLLAMNTTLVGTLRKNKADIPAAMQAGSDRPSTSSIFGFSGPLTMVSYAPKKNKAVILLSTMHHDATVSSTEGKKPEIILEYNRTKGGVDNLDRLIRAATTKRKSNRWPMVVFFDILDVGAVAAYNIWCLEHPQWSTVHHRRRIYLKELGNELVRAHLHRRLTNPSSLQKGVTIALHAIGMLQPRPPCQAAAPPSAKRRRCSYCPVHGPDGDRKTSTTCSICDKPICGTHQFITCNQCWSS
jgi:hypothetical protein